MKLTDFVTPDHVKMDLEGATKEEIIEELVELLGDTCGVCDTDKIFEAVMNRERDGSTGLEKGIAIPHAKCEAVDKLSIVVGIAKNGVDFDSLDGKPTNLFFLMVAPVTESGPHVQAIAKIVKMIKVEGFKDQLLKAKTAANVIDILSRVENGET
jgi:fructose-specific phosphotransferase system IIA component